MNVIIVGYGNVGKNIEKICIREGIIIKAIVSPHNPKATHKKLKDVEIEKNDWIIDFSHPDTVLNNVTFAVQNNLNIVLGTAGWESQKEEIEKMLAESEIIFLTSHNFMERVLNFWKTLESLLKMNDYHHAEISEIRVKGASKEYSSTAFHTTKIIAQYLGKKARRKTNEIIVENDKDKFVFLESFSNGKNHLDISIKLKSREGYLNLHFCIDDAKKANKEYAEKAVSLMKLENIKKLISKK